MNEGEFTVRFPLGKARDAYFYFPRALHGDEVERVLMMIDSLVIPSDDDTTATEDE